MKIRDTKIAEKLPSVEGASSLDEGFPDILYGRKEMFCEVLNAEIDCNEVAEVDVEKVKKLVLEEYGRDTTFTNKNGHKNATINVMRSELKWLALAIAKAGVLKWRDR